MSYPSVFINRNTCSDLRADWAKSLARAERWEEELALLKVEMKRVLRFLDFKARWWRECSSVRADIPSAIQMGIRSYAEKQAWIREELARKFSSEWLGLFTEYGISVPKNWPAKYRTICITHSRVKRRRHRTIAHQRRGSI